MPIKGSSEIKYGVKIKKVTVKARVGREKIGFPVFTYLIRAAGEEQEEKTGPKSDLVFLRYGAPNIEKSLKSLT